jgi:hypothetical protein
LAAGVKAIFGSGTAFVIVNAVGPVTVVARSIGSSNKNRTFAGVPAGFKFTADDPSDGFDTLEVTSATNQAFTIAVGDDDVEFSNAVTVTGGVVTQEVPKSTLADNAPVNCPTAAQTAVVPANGARRSVMLTVDPTFAPANPNALSFRKTGGVNTLIPIVIGLSYTFDATYGIDLRNDSGSACNVFILEES